MAEIEKVEYEFPDEKEAREAKESTQKELPLEKEAKAEESEIEVVDDRP